jgi:hypothetical protein
MKDSVASAVMYSVLTSPFLKRCGPMSRRTRRYPNVLSEPQRSAAGFFFLFAFSVSQYSVAPTIFFWYLVLFLKNEYD